MLTLMKRGKLNGQHNYANKKNSGYKEHIFLVPMSSL